MLDHLRETPRNQPTRHDMIERGATLIVVTHNHTAHNHTARLYNRSDLARQMRSVPWACWAHATQLDMLMVRSIHRLLGKTLSRLCDTTPDTLLGMRRARTARYFNKFEAHITPLP